MSTPPLPRRPTPSQPEFFLDRSLGRIVVAEALREIGLSVHTMAEIYPGGADEQVPDTQWIADADAAGWVALTKDERILRHADEQAALVASTLRIFAIGNQHLTGEQMAERLVANVHRILQRSRKRGPFVHIVGTDRVTQRWP